MESRPALNRAQLLPSRMPTATTNTTRSGVRRASLMAYICMCLAAAPACERTQSAPEAGAASNNNTEHRIPVAAVELTRRDLSRQLLTSGVVEPRVRTRLASRAAGTLEAVYFEEGDAVEAGQTLARLDMSEQEAELARAAAEETAALQDYTRISLLREDGVVSEADYERARAALLVARSARQLQETRIAFGEITAPHNAVITARYAEPGEAVDARGTLFELAAMDDLVIRLGVSELDVVHMSTGQQVPVRLDAMPHRELTGRIRRIFPTADSASRLITVEVSLPADAAALGVRPGFLGRVRFDIDPRPDVIAVPAASIGEDGERRYVFVIEDDRLRRREIETGVTRGQWTEVVSGLEEGEVILATSPIDMSDGTPVRIVGWRG